MQSTNESFVTTTQELDPDTVSMTACAPGTTRTNCVYLTKIELESTVASDLTDRFPDTSLEGNKYIMIL